MSILPLDAMFKPNAIVVVGVSDDPASAGHQVFRNIHAGGFLGPLYAVADEATKLAAAATFQHISDLPGRVDLAVIALPTEQLAKALQQCAEQGIKFALLVSSGSSVDDARSRGRLHDALERARRYGLRVVGPDCLGIMHAEAHLNASLGRGIARAGALALVSSSGAMCCAITDWADAHDVGFTSVAALGGAADIGLGDVLDRLAVDASTRAILVYIEEVDHVRRFLSGLRAAARHKPVLVLKGGRHGPEASGASGSHAVFAAALERAGAIGVATLEELLAGAQLLARGNWPRGEGLAIVTNAAAFGLLARDQLGDGGLSILPLSAATLERLGILLPAGALAGNPIDLRADATPANYAEATTLCLADPSVDAVLTLLSPQATTQPSDVAEALIACASKTTKPVLACFFGGSQVRIARERASAAGIACFDSPALAVAAFAQLTQQRRNQRRPSPPSAASGASELDIEGARLIVNAALAKGRSALSRLETKAILRAFGIPVVAAVRARDADEALVAAESLGFPVVLKIDSPDISSKSELRALRASIASASQVRAAYRDLRLDMSRRWPDAQIDGVIVEPLFARPGARALGLRVWRDRTFGPVLSIGPAGALVSLVDPALALPPLNELVVETLLGRAKLPELLGALRGLPPADQGALREVLARVSDLICELPEVQALEFDRLLVDTAGALALSTRLHVAHVPSGTPRYAHMAIAPCPRRLVQFVELSDGTQIRLRPIEPGDVDLEQAFVSNLSLESRVFRFMHALAHLTPEMLVQFTQLDFDRELALLAVRAGPEGDADEVLGIARYIADCDGHSCEFAVVVSDAWQKRGVGGALIGALIEAAREQRLTSMHGDVLSENRKMLAWVTRLGFKVMPNPEDSTLKRVLLQLQP